MLAGATRRCRRHGGRSTATRGFSATCRSAASSHFTLDPEWITLDAVADGDADEPTSRSRAHGLRRAIGDSVPRHQRRLAGKRSRAGRHHDGVRRADRRPCRSAARGEFDGVMRSAFRRPRIEGASRGERHARLGRRRGGAAAATSSSRTATSDVTNARVTGEASRDRRRRAVLARLPAQGRRRGDQRARPARRAGRWPICATRSCSTTSRSTARCPASSTCTAEYETPFGFGRCRSTRASPTASRSRPRPRRCGSRAAACGSTAIEVDESTAAR